jgi:hypothetical protein
MEFKHRLHVLLLLSINQQLLQLFRQGLAQLMRKHTQDLLGLLVIMPHPRHRIILQYPIPLYPIPPTTKLRRLHSKLLLHHRPTTTMLSLLLLNQTVISLLRKFKPLHPRHPDLYMRDSNIEIEEQIQCMGFQMSQYQTLG